MKLIKLFVKKFCSIVFLVVVLMVNPLVAQQDAQFTQYMFNGVFYNPAFAGKDGGYRFSALHRSQWLNYTGLNGPAPLTQLLTASGRLDNLNLGFGLTFVNDNIGATNNQELNLSFGYHKRLRRGVLSFGLSGGFFSSNLNYDELEFVIEETFLPAAGDETQINLNLGLGVVYDRGNYFIGLSSRHLNEPSFDFGDGALNNQLRNHTYLTVGYRIKTFALWSFEPSFLIKAVSFNNFSYDVGVIASHNNKISGGMTFRGQDSVSLLLGYSILSDNSLKVGYAFDLVVSGREAKAPTSHEFMLTYNLQPLAREYQKVIQRTPRFRF